MHDRRAHEGYCASDEHLRDALCRIDQLARACTVHWRMTLAAHKRPELWGMVCVSDGEIEAYLQSAYLPPAVLPAEVEQALAPYWQQADEMEQDMQSRLADTSRGIDLRLARLQHLFGLSDFERDVLLVCLLPELDPRYRRLYGYLQDDASRMRPTVELVWRVLGLGQPATVGWRECFNAAAPLVAHRLVELSSDAQGDEPLPMRSIRIDDRIAGFLLGGDGLDARLMGVVDQPGGLTWEQVATDGDVVACLQRLAGWWNERRLVSEPGPVLFLHGPYGSGRLGAARAFGEAAGAPVLVADVESGLRSAAGWERIVGVCYREAMLRGALVCWSGCEALLRDGQPAHYWQTLIGAAGAFCGPSCLASEMAWDAAGHFRDRLFVRLDFAVPGHDLRRNTWLRELTASARDGQPSLEHAAGCIELADALASSFQMTPGQIADAAATAHGLAARRDLACPYPAGEDWYEACRRQSGRRLVTFTRRIEPRAGISLDSLILPEANKRQLQELLNRVRNQSRLYADLGFERRLALGKGLIALFTGTSGTGKTMAAELLASQQGVSIYKVDLSAVVSKYVGETEKNLARVFAEAGDANAILFFDEADALFGKRGEVKEAQDRWANMEVNFLLQRIEEYSGVVILASNLRQNFDEAFMRRIHVIVEFPFPDAEARFRILCGLFPPGVGRPEDGDLRGMAERFNLAGGSLKNIVLDAAFRALTATVQDDGAPAITVRHLVAATAREYQKLGRPLTRGEFGEAYYGWVERDILLRANGDRR